MYISQSFVFWCIHLLVVVIWCVAALYTPQYLGHAFVGGIALVAIFNNNKINTKRATLEILLGTIDNTKLNDCFHAIRGKKLDSFRIAKIALGKITELSSSATEDEKADAQSVLRILNHYEFMCAGVRQRTLDYVMMRNLQYSNIVRIWTTYQPIVQQMRTDIDSQTLFQELQWLANKLNEKPLEKKR